MYASVRKAELNGSPGRRPDAPARAIGRHRPGRSPTACCSRRAGWPGGFGRGARVPHVDRAASRRRILAGSAVPGVARLARGAAGGILPARRAWTCSARPARPPPRSRPRTTACVSGGSGAGARRWHGLDGWSMGNIRAPPACGMGGRLHGTSPAGSGPAPRADRQRPSVRVRHRAAARRGPSRRCIWCRQVGPGRARDVPARNAAVARPTWAGPPGLAAGAARLPARPARWSAGKLARARARPGRPDLSGSTVIARPAARPGRSAARPPGRTGPGWTGRAVRGRAALVPGGERAPGDGARPGPAAGCRSGCPTAPRADGARPGAVGADPRAHGPRSGGRGGAGEGTGEAGAGKAAAGGAAGNR